MIIRSVERIDEKTDKIHARVTEIAVNHRGLSERVKSLKSRINWLYIIIGGIVVGVGTAIALGAIGVG